MDDETLYRFRGVYSQIAAAQQDAVHILADRRLTESRRRELLRRLEHIIEIVSEMEI